MSSLLSSPFFFSSFLLFFLPNSTLIMPCNNTGPTDPSTTLGWKYLDFDWSNWKGTGDADGWAKHKPMDCEELMVKQVQLTVAASPHQQAFVYRNMVKALPWFTSVREKISDPKYAKWFVRFSDAVVANHSLGHVPVCDKTLTTVCSDLYHDQSQTPGYPHGDGNCAAPGCDVGGVVPVGEYIFDHRNANVTVDGLTFIDWFITSYFGGPAGLGNDHIIGFYIDDDWGNMNPNGPSEMEGHAMEDMGLDTNDLKDMVTAYNWVTTQVYNAIVSKGKYAWNLFLNNDPNCINCGDCPQPWVKKESCAADLRAYGVNATSPFVNRALLYGFYPGSCHGVDPANLTEVDEDVANFLLVRGDYAYLGCVPSRVRKEACLVLVALFLRLTHTTSLPHHTHTHTHTLLSAPRRIPLVTLTGTAGRVVRGRMSFQLSG